MKNTEFSIHDQTSLIEQSITLECCDSDYNSISPDSMSPDERLLKKTDLYTKPSQILDMRTPDNKKIVSDTTQLNNIIDADTEQSVSSECCNSHYNFISPNSERLPKKTDLYTKPSQVIDIRTPDNKKTDLYTSPSPILNIHTPDNKKIVSETTQLKNIIDVNIDEFVDYIVKKNIDVMTFPLARNILSLMHILNLGLDKEYQKFNLQKIKSFLNYLKGNHFIADDYTDDDDNHINDIFGNMINTILSHLSSDETDDFDADIHSGSSKTQMSFSHNTHHEINQWRILDKTESLQGILTDNFSGRFKEFIQKEGHKKYYNDIYSRFHKDDIISTADILQDAFLYDFLCQSGQISSDELKKLLLIHKNKPALITHYNLLMSPEIMVDFLLQQKLLNPHSQNRFLTLFQDKPWFTSGGLQTLIQVIGGEIISPEEIHFFLEWHSKYHNQFNMLFDFFDIQKDFSLIRENEQNNMRSKHLSSDSVKAAYMTETFTGLKSANDPLSSEFFDLDFNKKVEHGFYQGFTYRDYFIFRGFDVQKIEKKKTSV